MDHIGVDHSGRIIAVSMRFFLSEACSNFVDSSAAAIRKNSGKSLDPLGSLLEAAMERYCDDSR